MTRPPEARPESTPPRLPALRRPRASVGSDSRVGCALANGRTRRRRALAGLATLVLAAGSACRESAPVFDPQVSPGERLVLAPAAGADAGTSAARVVRTLAIDAADGWTIEAQRAEPGPLPEEIVRLAGAAAPARALELEGLRDQRIVIPGPFEPNAFDQVRVRVLAPGTLRLSAVLVRGGERVAMSPWVRVHGETAFREHVLDVSTAPRKGPPFDALEIEVSYASGVWWLAGIELADRPARAWLPDPAAPDLVAIGHEARRGVGLSSRVPLEARARVPEQNGRLAFAFGLPPAVFDGRVASGAKLTVRVARTTAPGDPLEKSYKLFESPEPPGPPGSSGPPGTEGGPLGWREAWIALDDWAGDEVLVRFELAAPDAGDAELVCALAEVALFEGRTDPPTILFVTSDTHRADHVASAPRAVALRTDTLDALAARGIAFDDAFATSNITIPSHAALMTGRHPRDTGVLINKATLAADAPTLAEHFQDAGWTTFAVTSFGTLGRPGTGIVQGFDRASWPREGFRPAADTLAVLTTWLESARERPLFCWLHLYDAHTPYAAPEEYRRLYYPAGKNPFDPALGPQKFPSPGGMPGLRDIEFALAQYRSEVTYLDDELGAFLEGSRFERGLVAVTADHGEALGIKGIFWNHNGLYPDTVHVPLILAWPGAPAGVRAARPVRQTDLGRTLLDLAGLQSAEFPGRNLLDEEQAPEPRFALATAGKIASVTVGPWHLILTLQGGPKGQYKWIRDFERHAVELYRLDTDPTCERNLVFDEHERAKRMRALLVDWLQSSEPTGWSTTETRDEAVLAELADLGYAGDVGPANVLELFDPDCACERCQRYH